jgi:hypothetical protein
MKVSLNGPLVILLSFLFWNEKKKKTITTVAYSNRKYESEIITRT